MFGKRKGLSEVVARRGLDKGSTFLTQPFEEFMVQQFGDLYDVWKGEHENLDDYYTLINEV